MSRDFGKNVLEWNGTIEFRKSCKSSCDILLSADAAGLAPGCSCKSSLTNKESPRWQLAVLWSAQKRQSNGSMQVFPQAGQRALDSRITAQVIGLGDLEAGEDGRGAKGGTGLATAGRAVADVKSQRFGGGCHKRHRAALTACLHDGRGEI